MTAGRIILASASPRRRQLLDQIGVAYRVVEVTVDETRAPGEAPADYALRLALAKARAGRAAPGRVPGCPALGADTVVALGEEVLGKPAERRAALEMLARLSGRTHQVLTAVALAGERESTRLSVSSVTFRAISGAERAAYWETGEPLDKAGGYAIQGLGAVFVADLRGSYSGVVGLPLFETAQLLCEQGIDLWTDGRRRTGL